MLRFASIRLFADDALAYMSVRNIEENTLFQVDLDCLSKWAEDNRMCFNVDTCETVCFNSRVDTKLEFLYSLSGKVLQQVDSFRYLGVVVANNFKWDEHIHQISNKAHQKLGMIKRVPKKVKMISYLTLCTPTLEYACEAWDPYLVKHVDQLENIRRKAVRFICNVKGHDSITGARESLHIELLSERRKNSRIKLFLKILSKDVHSSLIDSFNSIFTCPDDVQHFTRSVSHLLPTVESTNYNFHFQSIIHRTSCDLRYDIFDNN